VLSSHRPQGGVFVDAAGAVVALWGSYSFPTDRQQQTVEEFFGLPSHTVRPVRSVALRYTANCIIIDHFLHLNRDWSPGFLYAA
jgi:hypothetical protein